MCDEQETYHKYWITLANGTTGTPEPSKSLTSPRRPVGAEGSLAQSAPVPSTAVRVLLLPAGPQFPEVREQTNHFLR